MKKINEIIVNYIKLVSGNILGIGLTDKNIIEALDKKKDIITCTLLNSAYTKKRINNISPIKSIKNKKINFNKLKKKFKKNSIDYIIADIEEIKPYMRNFVKDSIFITKTEITIFGKNDIYDMDKTIKRYKRYTKNIVFDNKDTYFTLKINTVDIKNKIILEKIYKVGDLLVDFIDAISDILCN